ncbi:MAG TPA: rhomboid family intramembrane serine protease [Solirubrobacteraceae bacterium]|jgi:membrane associated rhomboid family serine protease|nr:rhomboid family intramembrane serine protease [Solirubrobacteraceae bacterium]
MAPGADLFVVCKQCGSEVSPYITECPYCGARLRRRAPKLPREGEEDRERRPQKRSTPNLGRLRRGEMPGIRAESPPYATIGIVAASAVLWVLWRGGIVHGFSLQVIGPLNGHWWRLITSQFAYYNGMYAFVALIAIGLFGLLLEHRHGPVVTAALFLACGVTGALVEVAVYSQPWVGGGNAAALGLLAAWAVPDLRARQAGEDYEGDLLGTAVIAAIVLVMPLASHEVSELAGVTGGALGLLLGLGLGAMNGA